MRGGRHLLTAALVLILTSVALNAKCADVAEPAVLYLSLSAADLGSTYIAQHTPGVSEWNGLMRSRAIEKQLAVAAVLTVADVRLQQTGHGRSAKVLRGAVTVIRVACFAVAIRNAGRK